MLNEVLHLEFLHRGALSEKSEFSKSADPEAPVATSQENAFLGQHSFSPAVCV